MMKALAILAISFVLLSLTSRPFSRLAEADTHDLPCTYSLDGGDESTTLLADLVIGMKVDVICDVDAPILQANSELKGASWRITDDQGTGDPIVQQVIDLSSYRGKLVVKLNGTVPSVRDSKKIAPGPINDEDYSTDTAPPQFDQRVISLAYTSQNVQSATANFVHPMAVDVATKRAVMAAIVESLSTDDTDAIFRHISDLNDGGRPWIALSTLESIQPTLTALKTTQDDLRNVTGNRSFWRWAAVVTWIILLVAIVVGTLLGIRLLNITRKVEFDTSGGGISKPSSDSDDIPPLRDVTQQGADGSA